MHERSADLPLDPYSLWYSTDANPRLVKGGGKGPEPVETGRERQACGQPCQSGSLHGGFQ